MGNTTVDQVQRLVDHLTLLDQVRLMSYLTSRIAQNVASIHPTATPTSVTSNAAAWQEFFRIGDMLAANDRPESETLTTAVLRMRR